MTEGALLVDKTPRPNGETRNRLPSVCSDLASDPPGLCGQVQGHFSAAVTEPGRPGVVGGRPQPLAAWAHSQFPRLQCRHDVCKITREIALLSPVPPRPYSACAVGWRALDLAHSPLPLI